MTEFFHRDILQHVRDTGVFDVERLDPILQSRGKLACRATELLQQEGAEFGRLACRP